MQEVVGEDGKETAVYPAESGRTPPPVSSRKDMENPKRREGIGKYQSVKRNGITFIILVLAGTSREERGCLPVWQSMAGPNARLGLLGQREFPALPRRKCPAKVATWHFLEGKNKNPSTSILTNVYGAFKGGGRYWI